MGANAFPASPRAGMARSCASRRRTATSARGKPKA